ncbi:hypothetical protein K1T71_008423 [Dendrolimus kikuchii]|uniref:Uncharacterized protein n=1 Tax=Dendrolimus kikuchii TaxID=765133 RepID=A0ACC1CWZ8_9NEOP|nr:hypothetical protein K1T71_008423 [Dendrolimus kikuchii]
MEESKDKGSEAGDTEDIPSDFFDDFTNEEFIEGLSVIDSWDFKKEKNKSPINDASAVESQKPDLRDLISEIKNRPTSRSSQHASTKEKSPLKRSTSSSRLSDFIKPGSRRDPDKTNEAIRRDKEEKVKVYLAKHLEDDLRPPGTELDDYYNEDVSLKPTEKKPLEVVEEKIDKKRKRSRERRESPVKKRSPKRSPRRSPRKSPRRQRTSPRSSVRPALRHSPRRTRRSPVRRSPHHSPIRKHSPAWRNPRWQRRSRSPYRSRRSRSPQISRRSRSPLRRRDLRRSRSRSIGNIIDNFLYPKSVDNVYHPSNIPYPNVEGQFAAPGVPFMAPQEPVYSEYYGSGYDYGGPPGPMGIGAPQPMPMSLMGPAPAVPLAIAPNPTVPSMVPAPQLLSSSPSQPTNPPKHLVEYSNPQDGLAKLYEEGKISKEDYLKLAPNKGVSYTMDTQTRVKVLNRCHDLVSKLSKLLLPRRLVVNMKTIGTEQKSLPQKYCSPLKRQAHIDFNYTMHNSSMAQQRNKRLIDTIIATLGLETVVTRSKSSSKNMKDAEVQTTKPYCEVCDIREYTKKCEASTSIDTKHFSSSVHTQVIEEELLSSKAVFNPSGSVGEGATMSIAHMTPAQLVSQLAARAKTLKQSDGEQSSHGNQFNRWNQPNNNYNYGSRGGGPASSQQYQNYYRY